MTASIKIHNHFTEEEILSITNGSYKDSYIAKDTGLIYTIKSNGY